MKKMIFIAAIVLILLLGVWSSYVLFVQNARPTIKAVRGTISPVLVTSGTTKADRVAHLSFTTAGRIVYLPFKKNDTVSENQTVASLDIRDLQAASDKTLLDYQTARWEYDQFNEGHKDQVLTDTLKREKDKLQFTLDKSVHDVEIAQRGLENASLYAPFSGIVTEINGQLNEWTTPVATKPLVTIIDPTSLYFETEIEEDKISDVHIQQKGIVTLDAYPDRKITAAVEQIDTQVVKKENGDSILPVRMKIDSLEKNIFGLNGDVQMELPQKRNVLLIPRNIIVKKDTQDTVTIKTGFLPKTVVIKTGLTDAKNVEVVSGLNGTESIFVPAQ